MEGDTETTEWAICYGCSDIEVINLVHSKCRRSYPRLPHILAPSRDLASILLIQNSKLEILKLSEYSKGLTDISAISCELDSLLS